MNKKNIGLLVIAFLLFPISLMAQKEEGEKHRIKFTPTRLVEILYPGLELGYENRYGSFSSQFSAAYLVDIFGVLMDTHSLNGYHFKFEEKYFSQKLPTKKWFKSYVSVEINYNYVKQNTYVYFLPVEYKHFSWEEQMEYAYSGNYDLQRKAIVANLKFGLQIKVKKIIFEPTGGIGIGFQNVVYYNKLNPEDIFFKTSHHPNVYEMTQKEGHSILPNFTLSFRIGYMF